MVALDATMMNIALPSAQIERGFSYPNRQWVITAYALAFGSLLMLSERLAERFGRKNLFIFGLFGFAIASAIGGAALTFELHVAARAVQGAFAALLAPSALAYLERIVPRLIMLGLGLGLVMPTSISIAISGIRVEDTVVGSSLVSNAQQVGGAIVAAMLFRPGLVTARAAAHQETCPIQIVLAAAK